MTYSAVLSPNGPVDLLLDFVGGRVGGKRLVIVALVDITNMLEQRVWTTFHSAQAFVPEQLKNRWGRICVISSPIVSTLPVNNVPYHIAKLGEEALILSLAEELKYSDVTANIIRIPTIDVKNERDTYPTPKNTSWTTPEEIASMIDHLCSDEAAAVNGARLRMHGSK